MVSIISLYMQMKVMTTNSVFKAVAVQMNLFLFSMSIVSSTIIPNLSTPISLVKEAPFSWDEVF